MAISTSMGKKCALPIFTINLLAKSGITKIIALSPCADKLVRVLRCSFSNIYIKRC